MWTPLMIKMLLHYHTTVEPYAVNDKLHSMSPAVQEHRAILIREDYIVIDNNPSGYCTTDKAKCVIDYWMNAPQPEWRMPNG